VRSADGVWRPHSCAADPDDRDGDGAPSTACATGVPVDCNDRDSTVRPGATETWNGIDDDCDGKIDITCDGGLYDPVGDLCWQDPEPDDSLTWPDAMDYCAKLSLGGHGPGSWRLPAVTDFRDAGWPPELSATGPYWASSSTAGGAFSVCSIDRYNLLPVRCDDDRPMTSSVRCVRRGS
jgi:hypothetical protein